MTLPTIRYHENVGPQPRLQLAGYDISREASKHPLIQHKSGQIPRLPAFHPVAGMDQKETGLKNLSVLVVLVLLGIYENKVLHSEISTPSGNGIKV